MVCVYMLIYILIVASSYAYPSSTSKNGAGPIETVIRQKLTEQLKPIHLEVINESLKHGAPPGTEAHFRIKVVSPLFSDMPLLKRHQKVNEILKEELQKSVHALTLLKFTEYAGLLRRGYLECVVQLLEYKGPVETVIREKILKQFRPMYLDVINQSEMYGEHESSEKFFCIVVVSSAFTGTDTYQRHLCINALIQDEVVKNKIDGIVINAKTPDEWRQAQYKTPKAEPMLNVEEFEKAHFPIAW